MGSLNRKLIRDLAHMKGQALAISLVIAAGIATFVQSWSVIESLGLTQAMYYEQYGFAHVFAHLKRAPRSLESRIARIPGVGVAQTRVVVDVSLDVEGMIEPGVGRLISIPEHQRPALNGLHLRLGRYIEPGRKGEVVANEALVEAHGLKLGDHILAIINGHKQKLEIVGVALSPEYVYQIQPGQIIPDDKRYGVFWMGQTQLEAAFDMQGAFNDVCLALTPDASEAQVIEHLDRILDPYGGIGAYGRRDQLSHSFVADEITQLRGVGLIPPVIFLSVAGFLLHVVLSRLIGTEREQIAVFKAFGYTGTQIGFHYLKLVSMIVIIGVALGTAAGVWLGRDLTEIYTRYFRFPVFRYHLGLGAVLMALGVSALAAVAGVSSAVHRAVKLPPAQAMRPEPPVVYRPTIVERLGLQGLLSHTTRMILRQVERHPVKSLLSCLGIALGIAVLVVGSFMEDTVEYVMDFEFDYTQRQDMSVTFIDPVSSVAIHEIEHLPGVLHTEPSLTVPTRLRFGHRTRRVAIVGLEPDSRLYRLLDEDLRPVPIPEDGLLLSKKLADLLGVQVGQMLTVEVLQGHRLVRQVRVTGLVRNFVGTTAYMNLRALNRLNREGNRITGAFLAVDPRQQQGLYTLLKNTPKVAGVTIKQAAVANFQRLMDENILRMRTANMIFAGIIAFGVIYNSTRIWLSEQSRDLASLRVLGFTRGEISFVLLGQLGVLTLLAVPFGLGIGYGFAGLVTLALDTETHRFPLVIERSTYGFAVTVIVGASLLSGLFVHRNLTRLDLVAALKVRE